MKNLWKDQEKLSLLGLKRNEENLGKFLTKFNENLSKMDIMPKYFVKLNLYVKELRKLKWSVILSRKNIFSKKIYQVSYLKPKRNENCETIQNISLRIWNSKMKKSPCDEHYCKNLKNLAGTNFFLQNFVDVNNQNCLIWNQDLNN